MRNPKPEIRKKPKPERPQQWDSSYFDLRISDFGFRSETSGSGLRPFLEYLHLSNMLEIADHQSGVAQFMTWPACEDECAIGNKRKLRMRNR